MKKILYLLFISLSLYSFELNIYQKACTKGNGDACNSLGKIYEEGKDVKQNLDKAKKLYTKACDLNIAEGCFNLGNIYLHYENNPNKAKTLYQKACNLNNAKACAIIGGGYLIGAWDKNYYQAQKFFTKACKLGNGDSCASLGSLYSVGAGVKKDLKKAKELYQLGCNMKSGLGCFFMGEINYKKENYFKAFDFYKKSCDLGYKEGCEKKEEICAISGVGCPKIEF